MNTVEAFVIGYGKNTTLHAANSPHLLDQGYLKSYFKPVDFIFLSQILPAASKDAAS